MHSLDVRRREKAMEDRMATTWRLCGVVTVALAMSIGAAPAVVMNAVNDALRPLGATPLTDMPFTPEKILRALGRL